MKVAHWYSYSHTPPPSLKHTRLLPAPALPAPQHALAAAVLALNKPTVIVLFNGGSVAVAEELSSSNPTVAIVEVRERAAQRGKVGTATQQPETNPCRGAVSSSAPALGTLRGTAAAAAAAAATCKQLASNTHG